MDDSVELNMDFSLLTAHSTMLMAHSSQLTTHEIGFSVFGALGRHNFDSMIPQTFSGL